MSAPKRGKKYKEVLERGCGGYRTWTDWGWEYDCEHDYDWECDNCPIVVEQHKKPAGGRATRRMSRTRQ